MSANTPVKAVRHRGGIYLVDAEDRIVEGSFHKNKTAHTIYEFCDPQHAWMPPRYEVKDAPVRGYMLVRRWIAELEG